MVSNINSIDSKSEEKQLKLHFGTKEQFSYPSEIFLRILCFVDKPCNASSTHYYAELYLLGEFKEI